MRVCVRMDGRTASRLICLYEGRRVGLFFFGVYKTRPEVIKLLLRHPSPVLSCLPRFFCRKFTTGGYSA